MIRWLWSNLMKWGWDFNRDLRADEEPKMAAGRRRRGAINSISICDDETNRIDLPDPIRFQVQAVNGGTIVESRWYDPKKDESRVKLHIITSDQDLADSIGKIVTLELLQK
jgi:hypothetical protein